MDKRKKKEQTGFHSKRPHTITKMNDDINMNSAIAGSINDYMHKSDHYLGM